MRDELTPDQCPEPFWHETHRYCPICTWTEPQETRGGGKREAVIESQGREWSMRLTTRGGLVKSPGGVWAITVVPKEDLEAAQAREAKLREIVIEYAEHQSWRCTRKDGTVERDDETEHDQRQPEDDER